MKKIRKIALVFLATLLVLSPVIVQAEVGVGTETVEPDKVVKPSIPYAVKIKVTRPDVSYEHSIWRSVAEDGYMYEGYLPFRGYEYSDAHGWYAIYKGALVLSGGSQ
jgi:hypothetical protein